MPNSTQTARYSTSGSGCVTAAPEPNEPTILGHAGDIANTLCMLEQHTNRILEALFGSSLPRPDSVMPTTLKDLLASSSDRLVNLAGDLNSIAVRLGSQLPIPPPR